MIGVNILGQELELCKNAVFVLMSGVGIIVSVISFILLMFNVMDSNVPSKKNIIVFIVLFISTSMMCVGRYLSDNKKDVKYIKYYATIDDSVKWKDFTSKYDVIEQIGELYIIKENPEQNS